MGAGRNNNSQGTAAGITGANTTNISGLADNPYDPYLDPQGYALYNLNYAPASTPSTNLGIDNPTATGGTTKKPGDGSQFLNIATGIGTNVSAILNSLANVTLANKGVANPGTVVIGGTGGGNGNSNEQGGTPPSNDGGTKSNNTIFYIVGGILVIAIIFLVVSKSKKK